MNKKNVSRREVVAGAAGLIVGSVANRIPGTRAALAAQTPSLPDPTSVQGRPATPVGDRSPFEAPARQAVGVASRTPLQDLTGTITPADLHFERHHAGVPAIDPEEWELVIHGMVERPMVFTLDELRRLPAVSRICFLECSGNGNRNAGEETTAQSLCGLTSQSEWTGVPLSVLLREVGVSPEATWFTAEGTDAARLSRSIPIEKALDDALLAYGQNGEALRPSQGYPVRLLLPGWEGNASVKWLRRIEFTDGPAMSREETSKYTEVIGGEVARQFSFVMDAKSIITEPSYPATLHAGWNEIRGIAWSGRGRIERVEISVDGGQSWIDADLQGPILPKAHTRFRHMWNWGGEPATLMSRAIDETGYTQPTDGELLAARGGRPPGYHYNAIEVWRVNGDGTVVHDRETGA